MPRARPLVAAAALLLWAACLALVQLDPVGAHVGVALGLALAAAGLAVWARPRGLTWVLLATAGAVALFAFGAAERAPLTVTAAGQRVTVAYQGGRIVATDVGPFTAIRVRQDSYEASGAGTRRRGVAALPQIGQAFDWPLNGNLLSGITGVTASHVAQSSLDPATILWQPYPRGDQRTVAGPPPREPRMAGPDAPYDFVATPLGNDFVLTMTLIRPSVQVHVLLSGTRGAVDVVVYPEHSGIWIDRIEGDQRERLAGGVLVARKNFLQSSQQLGRQLGRAMLAALALFGVVLALGAVLARLPRCPAVLGPRRFHGMPDAPAPAPAARRARSGGYGALERDAALALAAIGLVATAYVASSVLERIPHVQDDIAYLFQARTFALGRLSVPLPPVPEAFQQEFILMREGQWYSKYPPGHPLVLTLGVLVGAPWLVSPVSAALALVVTFLFARAVFGARTALLAQILLLSSPFFLLMSGTMMSHPTSLLFAMLFAWQLERAERRDSPLAAVAAGLALGMLGASRALTAAAFALPFLAWVAVRLLRGRRLRPRHLALAAGASVPVIGVLLYNLALTGDLATNPFELWWRFDRIGFGPDVGMHGGHYPAWGLVNTWANLNELERWLFGWPTQLTLAFALLPFLTCSRRLWDWLLGAAVACVVVAYVFYWADGIMYGPRYYYEVAGLLAILSARGVMRCGELLGERGPEALRAAAARRAVALTLACGLVAATAATYTPGFVESSHGYNQIDRSEVDTIEAAGVHNALILVANTDAEWQIYGSVFSANSPLLDDDVIYARDRGEPWNADLLAAYPNRAVYQLDGSTLRLLRPSPR